MNYKLIIGALLVMALVLTACAPAPTEVTSTSEPTDVSTTEPTEAQLPKHQLPRIPQAAATEPAAAETATVSVPVTGEATVNVSELADFGPILVDGEGLSLYLFTNDTQRQW